MEIKGSDYCVWYDPVSKTITCSGSLRLSKMEEYAPIVQLLNDAADSQPSVITLNLQRLDFLNSSGINILSKFVIKVRQQKNIQIVVQGSSKNPWQGRSLKNLQRLMPLLQLEWD